MEEDEHVSKAKGIGAVARETGMSAKTIRYYEESGLLPAAERAVNGYRLYSDQAVHVLRFVKRARDLGFSMNDVSELLALWQDHRRASADVRKVATRHIRRVDQKIAELDGLRQTLTHIVERCHGDTRPKCPILNDIAGADWALNDRSTSGNTGRQLSVKY
jgi:MerR family transcriptional regulator, copper efflux regulator